MCCDVSLDWIAVLVIALKVTYTSLTEQMAMLKARILAASYQATHSYNYSCASIVVIIVRNLAGYT